MPATWPPTTMGIPMAPQATGAVLASRQSDGGVERVEAETGQHGCGDRHQGAETWPRLR